MARRHGPRSSNIIGRRLLTAALALSLISCGPWDPDRVDVSRYDSFWLWAGVPSGPDLAKAKELYILDGEVRGTPVQFVPLRAGTPSLPRQRVWLVIRTNTLDWPPQGIAAMAGRLDRWARTGTQVEGLQIDFDAATSKLPNYADFLARVRAALPARYKLSITGLMDWSAHGDPAALRQLGGIVDEVVIQTYQGRETIPGYDAYFARMTAFPIPFKVGLVQDGRWREPDGLAREPNFRGYVVFLLKR